MCCILHKKYNYTTDKCKDLKAVLNKHQQKNFKSYGKSNKELDAVIEKEKICKKQEMMEDRKGVSTLTETVIFV